MLKDYGIIKRIGDEMRSAADAVAKSVLNDYTNLTGREEEVTAQIRGEINRHLLENVRQRLNNEEINGCKISVATLKKKQEHSAGADLAGVIEIHASGRSISKAFLAQAKVGVDHPGPRGQVSVRAYSKDVVGQAEDMLKISSDSFIMVYSAGGIVCVPALQVALAGSNTIDTASHPFRTFGSFFEEFVKCFIGDHHISPGAMGAKTLEDYSEKLGAKSVLKLAVQLKPG